MTWVEYATGIAAIVAVVTPLVILINRVSRLCLTVEHFKDTVERLDEKLEKHLDWHFDHGYQITFQKQNMRKP